MELSQKEERNSKPELGAVSLNQVTERNAKIDEPYQLNHSSRVNVVDYADNQPVKVN